MTAPQAFGADAGRTWQVIISLVVPHQNVIGGKRGQHRGRRLDRRTQAPFN
jgi:hypothetical protein